MASDKRGTCPYCTAVVQIIEGIDQRCMAADGPVTPTVDEITAKEMRLIYRAALKGSKNA